MNLLIGFIPKNKNIRDFTKNISIEKKSHKDFLINAFTQKITHSIDIGAPEEIAISIIIDRISQHLDSLPPIDGGFSNILADLETFPLEYPEVLSYPKWLGFTNLFTFIDPYVHESSFFNDEGRKLAAKIDSIERFMADSMDQIEGKLRDTIRAEHAYAQSIYRQYEAFWYRLNRYHQKLKIILYGRAANSYLRFQPPVEHSRTRSYRFLFGAGISYDLSRRNEAVVDTGGTVRFETSPRLSATLSAGVCWYPFRSEETGPARRQALRPQPPENPFSDKQTRTAPDTAGYRNTKRRDWKAGILTGLLVEYYLQPIQNRATNDNRLGLAMALGYSYRRLTVVGKIGTRFSPFRAPRDFLNGLMVPTTTLDLSNDQFFKNKYIFNIGLSLIVPLN